MDMIPRLHTPQAVDLLSKFNAGVDLITLYSQHVSHSTLSVVYQKNMPPHFIYNPISPSVVDFFNNFVPLET